MWINILLANGHLGMLWNVRVQTFPTVPSPGKQSWSPQSLNKQCLEAGSLLVSVISILQPHVTCTANNGYLECLTLANQTWLNGKANAKFCGLLLTGNNSLCSCIICFFQFYSWVHFTRLCFFTLQPKNWSMHLQKLQAVSPVAEGFDIIIIWGTLDGTAGAV